MISGAHQLGGLTLALGEMPTGHPGWGWGAGIWALGPLSEVTLVLKWLVHTPKSPVQPEQARVQVPVWTSGLSIAGLFSNPA